MEYMILITMFIARTAGGELFLVRYIVNVYIILTA